MMGLLLCISAVCGACASDEKAGSGRDDVVNEHAEKAEDTEEEAAPENEEEEQQASQIYSSYPFELAAADTDRMIREAVEQYEAEDYTALSTPVAYNVLWLGFTHVTYGELDFKMTDFDREYLEAVVLNYEKSVESITDHNLDITVDLHFIDDETPLTKTEGDDWLYLAQETVQTHIDQYLSGKDFDTVLTTVQTAGDENAERNEGKEGYGVNYVMLGLETADMSASIGYSTFDLGVPREGTYPLADPEVPSLYATAVATHEWMHQLEYMGKLLGIEYPSTHAYMGPDSFPGYQKYTADENDYDFYEFYKQVLKGQLSYDNGGGVKHVGMYPKMWPLVKRNVMNLGSFTIKEAGGDAYLAGQESEPVLTVSDEPCIWNIRYSGDGRFILSPENIPDKRIDLGNAWDVEGNTIGIWVYTGYDDAQSWRMPANDDGSCSIQTPYESGRLLTGKKGEAALLCERGADGIQNWEITPVTR